MSLLASAADAFVAPNNFKKYRAQSTKKKVLRISDFFAIPHQSGLYYTYDGSLTHPPCLNNTRFSVFETPLYMNYEDVRNPLHNLIPPLLILGSSSLVVKVPVHPERVL